MRTRILWAAMCALLALGGQAAAQGLGDGRGIDHVAAFVRAENFADAAAVWTDQLGFSLTTSLLSPLGARNRLIWFDDQSYLELVMITERNPFTEPFLAFLEHHEGLKYYGSEVVDAGQAAAFLTGAGYPNTGLVPAPPLTAEPSGQVVGLTPLWHLVILTERLAPDNSSFFVDYDEAEVEQVLADVPTLAPQPHPNTAQRIDTLWLVVADLDAAIGFYEGLGLEVRFKNKKIHHLGARGAEVRYKNSTLALLVPDGPGPVADFAADRGVGLLGLSVQVADLAAAHALVTGNTGLELPIFQEKGRERFLVPASLTHGVLLEMVE